jgi:hypothetical protein
MIMSAIKWTPPTITPTKTLALDGRYWILVEQNTAGAQSKYWLRKIHSKIPEAFKKY